jgi:competence protein ComEC
MGPGSEAAALSMRRRVAHRLAVLQAEIADQADRWTLWAPVAFGLGCAGYMTLKVEPSTGLAVGLMLAALALLAVARRLNSAGWLVLAALLAFTAAGFLSGRIRTLQVAAPIAPEEQRARLVEGWVVDVASPGASGMRLLIAPVTIQGLAPEETPVRIRVTLRDQPPVTPGSAIRLRAMIGPPPAPASPGAYDFARDAWFNRVGGVGFTLGDLRTTTLAPPPWRLRLTMAINATRWRLAQRLYERMGPESGGLGAAMVTGHEAWIPPQQTEVMRASGLAHIISISGLHMAIVGGFVFAGVRLLVALLPWVALRVPGKKVAALAGLVAVGGYLVISGAPPPAERAAVTAAAAFLAILVDRQAISLRTLAIAALVILAGQPEAACAPGFQMSFAATAALVALAEAWPRAVKEIDIPWWIRAPQATAVWLGAAIAASFVAGLATGPFAMHHFNRVASYGLIANLLVAPLSSFVIMPFLAIGAVLEPLGLGGPFLAVAGWGIEGMLGVGAATASRPGAVATIASAPGAALPIAFLGVMVLCLWKGPIRWLGAPLAAAVLLWPRPAAPDAWIAADGAAVAIRDGGQAILLRPDARRFAADLWARRRGLSVEEDPEAVRDARFACDRFACLPTGDDDIAVWAGRKPPRPAELAVLCAPGRLVVLRSGYAGQGCEDSFLLSADDFAQGGSAELWRRGEGWAVVWANDLRGDRPWTR